MKYKIIIPILGFLALAGIGGSVEGQQTIPAPTAAVTAEKTIIEVQGSKQDALKILKSQGVSAIELRGSAYILPQVTISAPSQVDVGDMIVVSADLDKTKYPDGLQQVKFQWTVLEDGRLKPNTIVWPDGSRIFFAAGMRPKVYTVILDVDALFATPQTVAGATVLANAEIDSPPLSVTSIQVGDPTPVPVPVPPTPTPVPPVPVPPTPTPTPVPVVLPDGKYKLSQFAYDAVNTSVGLTQAERVSIAGAYATGFDATSAKIAALSTMGTVEAIMADLKAGNDAALKLTGIASTKYASIKTAISDKIYSLSSTGSVVTIDDFATAFREISLGLKAVVK